jgi:hypothetical protein
MRPGIVLVSTKQAPHAFPLPVDHDLLFDLRHLDDPEPPSFNALRASDAVRLAAEARVRRSRIVASGALSLTVLAGVGVALLRVETEPPAMLGSAGALSTTAPLQTPPTGGSVAPPPPGPSPTDPAATTVPTTAGPAGSGPATTVAGAPSTTLRPGSGAPVLTTVTSAFPALAPPSGTRPAPAGIGYTLSLDATSVTAGGSVTGVVRFENRRSTPVTLTIGGCSLWHADLYRAGQQSTGLGPTCAAIQRSVVAPGQVVEADVQIATGAGLAPGPYAAYGTIRLEEDGFGIHTNGVAVTVARP